MRITCIGSQQKPLQPQKMVVVYGFGCNHFGRAVSARQIMLNQIRNKEAILDVEVMCNTIDSKSMTYDIWRRLKNKDLEPTPFVEHVMIDVASKLARGEHVLLVGHSYGGSVASRVAMFLSEYEYDQVHNLQIGTFGSIFIPPPEATGSIDIRHYVYANDIAMLCHKRSNSYENLILLDSRYKANPVYSHMDYDHWIARVAQSGSLDSIL